MTKHTNLSNVPLAAMTLALLAQAWTAFAQEPPPPPPPPPAAEQPPAPQPCVPSCRAGYACVDGRCLSPCNPQCPNAEVCTRNGLCLPATAPPPPSVPSTLATPRPLAATSTYDQSEDRSDQSELRDKFDSQRHGGVALIIFSILAGTAGGILVSVGNDDMIIAGYVISPLELIFGIPGIALVVTGSTGLGKLDKGIPITQAGPKLRVGATSLTVEF
jgi:hypothetical protein